MALPGGASDKGLEGWKVGRLEGWKAGRLEGWKVGRLRGWKAGRLEDWMVDLFFHSCNHPTIQSSNLPALHKHLPAAGTARPLPSAGYACRLRPASHLPRPGPDRPGKCC